MSPESMTLLYAGDRPEVAAALRVLLSEKAPDIRLMTTQGSPDGLAQPLDAHRDIILLDMDGHALCGEIKADARLAGVPVLFTADYGMDPALREMAVMIGADGFLPMPFDGAGVMTQLRAMRALGKARRLAVTPPAGGNREAGWNFASPVDHLPDFSWVLDIEAESFLQMDSGVTALLGWTPDELLSLPVGAVLNPAALKGLRADTRKRAADLLAGKISPETTFSDRVEQLRRDGSSVWTEVLTHYEINPVTGRSELHGVTRDNQWRRELDETQLKSGAAFRLIINNLLEQVSESTPLELSDLLDVGVLKSLLEDFSRITSIGGSIFDRHGNMLASTGFQDVCREFHRTHSGTLQNCIESMAFPEAGAARCLHCKNGLVKIATPIAVGGQTLGYLYLGQCFFDDDPPDTDFYRELARKHGFDEAEYLAAIERVPRVKRETVETAMAFFARLTGMFSALSHSALRLHETLAKQRRVESELRDSESRYAQLAQNSRTFTWEMDLDGLYTHVGDIVEQVLGYRPEELVGRLHFYDLHPEEGREAFKRAILEAFARGGSFVDFSNRAMTRDGRIVWLSTSGLPILDADGNLRGYRGSDTDITTRKRAEEAIHNLFDNAPVGIFHSLSGGRLVSANRALAKMLGWPSPELLIGEVTDLSSQVYAHPEDRKNFLAAMLAAEGWHIFKDVEWTRKDGRGIRVDLTGRRVANPDGTTAYFEAFVEDVSELRLTMLTQEFLLKCGQPGTGEDYFESLARHLSDILGMEYVCIDSLEGDGLIAETVAVFNDGHIEDNVRYALKDTPCGEVLDKNVCCFPAGVRRIFPKDGALHDLKAESYLGTTLWDSKGRPIGLIACISRKVMDNPGRNEFLLNLVAPSAAAELERRMAEVELGRFKHTMDSANYGLAIADMDGVLTYANNYFAKVHGYAVGDLVGTQVSSLHTEAQMARVAELLGKMITEGSFDAEEVWHRHKNGGVFPMLMSGTLFRDKHGVSRSLLVSAIDLTESKKVEEQLRQSQKMESVGRLAGGVAHDFNNMLGVILGHAEMALRRLSPGMPLHDDLLEIQKAGERSANLTRQLLAFARKQTAVPRVLNLNETIGDMLKMLRRLIGETIELVWTPGKNLWRVHMDPGQVDQVLANLCVNARDAISGIGTVTIRTENMALGKEYTDKFQDAVPGHYVLLSVSDTGCGMDEDTLSRIFDPFFTTKGVGEGTGLGLATVYGILMQNGGIVDAQSGIGRGTTVSLHIPRYTGSGPVEEKTVFAHAQKGGGETVLLVEDELTLLRMGRRMLETFGYRVLAAGGAEEAMALAAGHQGEIHLLLTDVLMPGMDGKELSKRLLASRPDMKCLFISGHTADTMARQGIIDMGTNFIQKPFKLHDFAAAVRAALDSAE